MTRNISTKRCPRCKTIKPISGFYKHRSRKDGFSVWCKVCHNTDQKRYRQTKKGKAVNLRAIKKYQKTEKGKAVKRASIKRFFARNPNQLKAVNAVKKEIRIGKIPKPSFYKCKCGKQAEQYHHHKGYAPEHWLDVVPVCKKCHRKIA